MGERRLGLRVEYDRVREIESPLSEAPVALRGRMPSSLTRRELEVLSLLADGADTDEISERLVISPTTARSHVAAILQKLNAKNRTQAVVRAIALGLLDVER
jgi:DNA-binding NarL/FixJ family response regulator